MSHSGPPLFQDLHCCSASIVAGHLLSQAHLHCLWISTTVGTPMSQDLYCLSTSDYTVPPVRQDFYFPSTSHVRGLRYSVLVPHMYQDFQCHRTSIVIASQLSKDLCSLGTSSNSAPLRSRTSTVAANALCHDLHCCRTSNVERCPLL